MIKKVLMLVVCVAVVLALVPSYVGAASPSAGAGIAQEQEYTKAINKLERYLSISETGNIVLDAPTGIVNSIDSEVYQSLLAGLEQTNSMIDSGYLVCNPDFTLTVTEKYLESSSQYLEPNSQLVAEGNAVYLVEGIQTLSFSGVNKVVWYWWGFYLYLDNATCIKICAGLSVAALIALFIPDPLASKIVAVVMGAFAATIAATNIYGRGVKIRFHYIPPFVWPRIIVPTGIWSQ